MHSPTTVCSTTAAMPWPASSGVPRWPTIAASESRNSGSATSARKAGTASRRISRSWVRGTDRAWSIRPRGSAGSCARHGGRSRPQRPAARARPGRRLPDARPHVGQVHGVRRRVGVVAPRAGHHAAVEERGRVAGPDLHAVGDRDEPLQPPGHPVVVLVGDSGHGVGGVARRGGEPAAHSDQAQLQGALDRQRRVDLVDPRPHRRAVGAHVQSTSATPMTPGAKPTSSQGDAMGFWWISRPTPAATTPKAPPMMHRPMRDTTAWSSR